VWSTLLSTIFLPPQRLVSGFLFSSVYFTRRNSSHPPPFLSWDPPRPESSFPRSSVESSSPTRRAFSLLDPRENRGPLLFRLASRDSHSRFSGAVLRRAPLGRPGELSTPGATPPNPSWRFQRPTTPMSFFLKEMQDGFSFFPRLHFSIIVEINAPGSTPSIFWLFCIVRVTRDVCANTQGSPRFSQKSINLRHLK